MKLPTDKEMGAIVSGPQNIQPGEDKTMTVNNNVKSVPGEYNFAEYSKAASEFMIKDLAKSGLVPEDMGTFIPSQLSAFHTKADRYRIPYFDRDGKLLDAMYRERLTVPKISPRTGKAQKYDQPSKDKAGPYSNFPYFPPARLANDGKVKDIHEGEKKSVIGAKCGQHAIAIGGAGNWRDPNNKDAVHPEILAEHADSECIRMWPDGDIHSNLNVQLEWTTFARALMSPLGLSKEQVRIMDLSVFGPGAKFDDLIPVHGYDAVLAKARQIDVNELKISGKQLKDAVSLLEVSTTEAEDGSQRITVAATESNFAKIFRSYPYFKNQLWFNEDRCEFMYGDAPWDEHGIIVIKMLELFQSVLGFSKKGTKGNLATSGMLQSAMLLVAWENRHSPRNAYLQTLKWDGTPRLDSWLSDYCWADPTDQFVKKAGAAFLIAAVGRTMEPGCFYRFMLILCGPQGTGKSGVADALFGPENVKVISKTNATGKDEQQLLGTTSCGNFDELAALTRQDDRQHLKSTISLRYYDVRLPYAKAFSKMPSRCVLIGSTDMPDQFLSNDAAGNGRFVVVEVGNKGAYVEFDFKGLNQVRDQLWAEAVVRYRRGERFDVVEGAVQRAENYVDTRHQDTALTAFSQGFDEVYAWPKSKKGSPKVFFKVSTLEDWLALRGSRIPPKDLRAGLEKLGFEFNANGLRVSDGYQSTGRVVVILAERLQALTGCSVKAKEWLKAVAALPVVKDAGGAGSEELAA